MVAAQNLKIAVTDVVAEALSFHPHKMAACSFKALHEEKNDSLREEENMSVQE